MAKLEIADRIDNAELDTFTLLVVDRDNADDVGAMYHFAAKPPAHANVSLEDWAKQAAAHALHHEATSRGIELPEGAASDPGALGRAQPPKPQDAAAPLEESEADELRELRVDQVASDQAARDRAELEQLRAAKHAGGQPTA